MRILSMIVAGIAIVAAFFSISTISKYSEMFEETSTTIPLLTQVMLDSSGWIPGGIFLFAAATISFLVIAKKDRRAGIAAILTVCFMVLAVFVIPVLLLSSVSKLIHDVESSQGSEAADKNLQTQ